MIDKRISLNLQPTDIFVYDTHLLKTASVNLPDNIPYDPNFLYVEVRAVSAGEYYGNNKNIDYFPEDQLNPPKGSQYGKDTFLTAHVFKNHDNKDVANAIGDVLTTKWDDEMKGVNLLIRIDKVQNASVARGFELGYITDVSMGCRVHHVVCSICGHSARTKADYCKHLREEKGKIYSDGRKVQEINMQPKFHDISVVLNGAEKVAKVMRIYKDDSMKNQKVASLTTEDMTRIALELGMSKVASADDLGGMMKIAGFENGSIEDNVEKLASHDDVRKFISEYIEASNRNNLDKIALEQAFDSVDPKKQAFSKLATMQKLSEFEKRIEGEIIRTSAKDVEEKMKAEVDADDDFTAALNVAKARNFTEMGDEEMDEISKKLLAISEEKRIPRFEVLRTFFTVLATKGIHLTLTEFSHLTMHVMKGMAFEGDHDVFERKINDYRARLTEMIMNDIKNQEIVPGTGLHNVQNAIRQQPSPLGMNGLDKMIMSLAGAAPFGVRAIVRRPMVKMASYQEGATSPAGICGSEMTNEVIFDMETMVDMCSPLANRNKHIMAYAGDIMDIAEMEKTADTKILYENKKGKKMFHELIGDSDTEENIKMYLDGAKRSGLSAKVIPWDTPYDKPMQEKTAAPMFGKGRYKWRNHHSDHYRQIKEMELHKFKRESNDPTFNEKEMEELRERHRPVNETYNREVSKEGKTLVSSVLAADMVRRGGRRLLNDDKEGAKRFAAVAGLASIYPAYRGLGHLKKRYHFSKQENIDKDKAEREIDRQVEDRTDNYIRSQKSDEDGWHAVRHNANPVVLESIIGEAKAKGGRVRYNSDFSVNIVSKSGRVGRKRWPLNELGDPNENYR